MAQSFSEISDDHRAFIEAQKVFFVATAAPDGRVNVSPKGLDSLKVLGPNRVLWLNLTGSGNETAAHVLESPRMTLMVCAFDGPPKILRLYGQPRTLHEGDPEWGELRAMFPAYAGARQLFDVEIDLVQDSCGMGVPVMEYVSSRGEEDLEPHFDKLGPERTKEYQQKKNRTSLDGKSTDIA